ncbi:MAG: hypothetical protein JW913_11955 [Chitinispirillaceae bacterium]|nr:hypothetical protein [Chitinispirillaceae bacterium]
MSNNGEDKQAVLLFVLLALLSSLIFYQTTRFYKIDGKYAATNMDTFLYMQYARSFAQGHPYQFNAGDPPTTGCTSHLYPAILGFFYLIGIKDFALLEFAFWLNVFFFIISVVFLWFIVLKLEPRGRWLIMALFTLSGYIMFIFAGLSDMGLFIVLTFALWLSMIQERYVPGAVSLFFLPFARPEGVIIACIYPLVLLYEYKKTGKLDFSYLKWIVAGAGLLGSIGIIILNVSLTGMIPFDSTLGKSYFSWMQLLTALNFTVRDTLVLWKNILFGLEYSFRQYFFIPVISGVLILLGLFHHDTKNRTDFSSHATELWWLVSVLFASLMVVTSSCIGIHYDRYFFWILPLLILYMVRGAFSLPLKKNVQVGVFSIFILFQIIAYLFFLQSHILNSAKTAPIIHGVRKANESFAPNMLVAVRGGSGVKYLNPRWRIVNLGGVTSPWFRECRGNIAEEIKICQHRPDLRFDRFMKLPGGTLPVREIIDDSVVVEFASQFGSPITFYSINWRLLLRGERPLTDTVSRNLPVNVKLTGHLDAAWNVGEKRAGFERYSRYPYNREIPVLTKGMIGDSQLVDAIRPIVGGVFFSFKTIPGKKHWLVFRIVVEEQVKFNGLNGPYSLRLNTGSVKFLTLKILNRYNEKIDMTDVKTLKDTHYLERMVPIPGSVITSGTTEFGLIGDLLLCDVWLYAEQP